jgi:uncharacterized membrane protein (GlpM family)
MATQNVHLFFFAFANLLRLPRHNVASRLFPLFPEFANSEFQITGRESAIEFVKSAVLIVKCLDVQTGEPC